MIADGVWHGGRDRGSTKAKPKTEAQIERDILGSKTKKPEPATMRGTKTKDVQTARKAESEPASPEVFTSSYLDRWASAPSTVGDLRETGGGKRRSNCWEWARSLCSAAEDTGDWLKEHPGLVHVGVSVGVGTVAFASAAAACVGTAGIGCPVAAAAAVGMLIGTPAHLFTAEALDEEVTVEKGFGWMLGSALSPAIRTVVTTIFQINVAKRVLDIVLGREPVLP